KQEYKDAMLLKKSFSNIWLDIACSSWVNYVLTKHAKRAFDGIHGGSSVCC
ncbi:hypothetical protein U1Q18_016508, partial [Sarracenia purpurea var. burkii]